jgi:hypothetical protein
MPKHFIPLLALLVSGAVGHLSVASASPHYSMDVVVDYDAGSFAGDLRVEVQNTTGIELAELFFRLYPNAAGIYGSASVQVIGTLVDGQAVATETFVEDTVLYVPLPEPLPPDARVTVTIAFEGSADDWLAEVPPPYAYGLLTRSAQALTLTAFYPILALYTKEGWSLNPVFEFGDALMSEASTYEVSLTIPAGITPVSSGTLSDEILGDVSATYRYAVEGARDFSVVLLDGYEHQDATVDGVTLRVWFTPEKRRAADITLQRASDALTLFGDLFGPIRYGEVELVELPLQHAAGVEFSGLIFVSSAYAEAPDDAFYDIIVSHEMAHQWFYAGVGNNITEDPWLDESLATYLSYLFLDAFVGSSVASGTLGYWERSYDRARGDSSAATIASPTYAFSGSSKYSAFVYSGGAVFIHAIREAIGDGPFFAALASYYAENLGRIATPADLIGAFEASCGCLLTDLLRAFGLRP